MVGLIYDESTRTVKGVRIKKRSEKAKQKESDHVKSEYEGGAEEEGGVTELLADVVVCATGRRNQMTKWLAEANVIGKGDELPQETTASSVGYVTSIWRPPTGTRNRTISNCDA